MLSHLKIRDRQTSASNIGSVNSGGKWAESSWQNYDEENCADEDEDCAAADTDAADYDGYADDDEDCADAD